MTARPSPAIVSRPDVLDGAPCIAGTRIPARAIKTFWKAKKSVPEIQAEYPSLTHGQIAAAIAYRAPRAMPAQQRVAAVQAALDAARAIPPGGGTHDPAMAALAAYERAMGRAIDAEQIERMRGWGIQP